MTHPVTTNFGLGNFYATFLTNNPPVLEALVFAAQAFVVLDRAKNLGTKQTVTLGLKSAVVDCFRLFDLAKRPRANLFRRCHANLDGIKMLIGRDLFEQVE